MQWVIGYSELILTVNTFSCLVLWPCNRSMYKAYKKVNLHILLMLTFNDMLILDIFET